jgi:hypothetical protein
LLDPWLPEELRACIEQSVQKVGGQSYFGMQFVFPRERVKLKVFCQSLDVCTFALSHCSCDTLIAGLSL